MEENNMIRCKTTLDNNTILALSKYHHRHKKDTKRKQGFIIFLAVFVFVLSCINAYGIWMKYIGTISPIIIILRASFFLALSSIILVNAIRGGAQKTYRELKKYFEKTKTDHLDYIIDEESIQMVINSNTTVCKWSEIDIFESDDNYFYFSSKGKHTLIAKAPMAEENIKKLDELSKNARCTSVIL